MIWKFVYPIVKEVCYHCQMFETLLTVQDGGLFFICNHAAEMNH